MATSPYSKLQDLIDVGPATRQDLQLLGISKPDQLLGRDAYQLYAELCQITGQRHDPCVIDVFLAATHNASTGEARRWWSFTAQRKSNLAARQG